MSVLAQRIQEDLQTRAANDDDFNSGPKTRTKYSYVYNNPLTYFDPSGFQSEGSCRFVQVRDHAQEAERWHRLAADRAWQEQSAMQLWEENRQLAEWYLQYVSQGGFVPPDRASAYSAWATATQNELPPMLVWGGIEDLPPIYKDFESCQPGTRDDAFLRSVAEYIVNPRATFNFGWRILRAQGKKSADVVTSPQDVLKPNGKLIGHVERGATDNIRTVSKEEFAKLKEELTIGATPGSAYAGGAGQWYELPNGAGRIGVRRSRNSGETLDVDVPGVGRDVKVHQK